MADLVRAAGQTFIERSRQWISGKHIQVLLAIVRCRTAVLGGHLEECTRCGHRAISYNSCRNRHCPKCQASARERWLEKRRRELLPTPYVHVVFTLPRPLAPLALQNKKVVYNLLFRSSAQTLLEVARDPHHLGAEIGFFRVLHTWSQKLALHPHVHGVVPAGGLSADRTRWIKPRYAFLLPVQVLSRVFRGKFVAALQRAFQDGPLSFHGDLRPLAQRKTLDTWLRPLFRKDWVVYAKRPFGGPEYVLRYLGRYTHRVAISNHRRVSFADQKVTFRWRDSAHQNEQRLRTLSLDEFLRRFLLHLLPDSFVRIRNFGFLANRRRSTFLPLGFQLLGWAPQTAPDTPGTQDSSDLWFCPKGAAPMMVVERLTPAEMQLRSPPEVTAAAGNNSWHPENSACFATVRRGSPYRRTHLFFRLPQGLAWQHFLADASFPTRCVICCAPLHSSGEPPRPPLPPFNFHRARVRRAGGFLQVALSKARQNKLFPSSPSEQARFR